MPGRLTVSQRLTRPDGLPTAAARLSVVALMAFAATAGYASTPERSGPSAPPRAIAASKLAGDLPIPAPETAPALQRAHPVPAMRGGAVRRRTAPIRREPAPAPAPEPTTAPEPAATATPEPVSAPPVAAPAPPAPVPQPGSTPAPTFDLSG